MVHELYKDSPLKYKESEQNTPTEFNGNTILATVQISPLKGMD